MSLLRSLAASLAVTACVVHPPDPAGRACDATHPCGGGRICGPQGICIEGGATCALPSECAAPPAGSCSATGLCGARSRCLYGLAPESILASADDGNVPSNLLDCALSTRWAAEGDGQWVQVDLGSPRLIVHVRIAFPYGTIRQDFFDLHTSLDGQVWTVAYSGQSSGLTEALQTFDFEETTARHVRFVGHGNTETWNRYWNSISELEVWGEVH